MRNYWQQIPSTEDLEQLVGADSITLLDFVAAIAVIVVAFIASRLVRRVVRWGLSRFEQVPDEIAALVGRAAGWFVVLFGIVYSLVVLGIDMVPALILIIIIAVVVFFAGRRMMENFSAGLVLHGTPMFAMGDEIITTSGAGVVREITGRTVVIENPDGEKIYIPNQNIITEAITNLTDQDARRSTIDVGVAYGTDLGHAKDVIERAAVACSETRSTPKPEALFSEFGVNSINFQLLFWHAPTILERLRAIDAVGRSIAQAFADNGIVIAFPQRTLWWGDTEPDPSDTDDNS